MCARCPALPGASCWFWASYPGNKSTINRPALVLGARQSFALSQVRELGLGETPPSQDSVLAILAQGPLASPPTNPTLAGALAQRASKTVPFRYRRVL